MDLVGKYIASRYEIIEKIGNGGMATVYKAKCHVLNRFVAIKVLKEEFTTDEEFIRRFNVEAQSAAGLTHPNIVSIYDVGHENGIYFIVMELIQGKTLKQIINEEGRLPWKWSVNIAIQIASALETAHKNNIIHRDIKPHNIIITEDGVAKVTDFGIAKAVSNSTITAFGTTIGSVHYFSPEHARGGFTDAKSDLYSLGVVIRINQDIPLAVNNIIMKAMQKEPSARYLSATEMLKDLSMALKKPEGNFVVQDTVDLGRTQVMGTITDDMLKDNKENAKHTNKKKNKIKEFFTKYPKMKIILLAIVFILVFVLTVFITKFAINAGTIKDVEIPELVGLTEEEVIQKLKNTKFTYEIAGEDYSSEIEAGKVMTQNPAYRKTIKIKENSKIVLTLSKGTEKTTVPKVAGMTFEEAEKELIAAKLKVEKIEEKSDKVQEGIVIRQETEAYTEVNAGETVKVYVSIGKGLEQVAVTYVIGKTEEAAKKELEDAKLKVEIVYEEDTTKPEGTVLKQNKEVGTVVEEGTTIVLTVNKIAEIKTGTVNINLKSLTGYKEPTKTGNEILPEVPTAKVMVKVNEDIVYNEQDKKDTTKISVQVQGKGRVEIKLFIDEVLKATKILDFNSSNTVVNFE